jgi:hypothetical protein
MLLLRGASLISAVPLLCCAPLPELMNELRENIERRGYASTLQQSVIKNSNPWEKCEPSI